MGTTDQALLAGMVVDPDEQNEWFEVPAHIRIRERLAGKRTPTYRKRLQKLFLDRIGFTGTQVGMTTAQRYRVSSLLAFHTPGEVHHGDCVGADADFDALCHTVSKIQYGDFVIHLHPWNGPDSKRAHCERHTPGQGLARHTTILHHPAPPLDRNRVIVNAVQGMIATPKESLEEIRSGTWATIRYALQTRRWLWVIYPTGAVAVVPGLVPE